MPVKKIIAFFCILIIFTTQILSPHLAYSDTVDTSSGALDNINKQLADLTQALSNSVAATKPLQSQLDSMKKQIAGIKTQVDGIESDIALKKTQIDAGYKDLAEKQTILHQTIRDFYINTYNDS